LGPFFRNDTPPTENDASIIKTMPSDGEVVYMHGIVQDAATGEPIEGVIIDIWQCSTNGLYEQQDPDQAAFNLRGHLTTDEAGYYGLFCLRPVPYPVPDDGNYIRIFVVESDPALTVLQDQPADCCSFSIAIHTVQLISTSW
jgi:catechol 1,2-dioxygenase